MTRRAVVLSLGGLAVLVAGISVVLAQPGGFGPGGAGGPGGRGMMDNMVFGAVTAGDINQGWIKVTMGGGRGGPGGPGAGERTVSITQDTALVTTRQATLADLREGNGLMVTGVPTGLIGNRFVTGANSVAVAEAMSIMGGGRMGFRGGPGAPAGTQESLVPPSFGTVAGRITGLAPLRVEVSDELTVEIKPAPDATYIQIVDVPWDRLAQNDRVFCTGEASPDGGFVASTVVIITQDMWPGGRGMFGGNRPQ